jgi:hypothetical protein
MIEDGETPSIIQHCTDRANTYACNFLHEEHSDPLRKNYRRKAQLFLNRAATLQLSLQENQPTE